MRSILLLLAGFYLLTCLAWADDAPTTNNAPSRAPTPAPRNSLESLAQSNRDLLALLKEQQSVLEDMQVEVKRKDRQIQSLEERLTTALLQNSELHAQIAKLQAAANAPSPAATNSAPPPPASPQPSATVTDKPPPPPSTYLPPPESEGAPGTMSWHRLFTLSGQETKKTDLFHIQSKHWRVIWHNLDKPDAAAKNTSALFISAFPKDDTIPQKVCAKLGTGGDSTELAGPGNYYLKIEASGGSWELAVEEFR